MYAITAMTICQKGANLCYRQPTDMSTNYCVSIRHMNLIHSTSISGSYTPIIWWLLNSWNGNISWSPRSDLTACDFFLWVDLRVKCTVVEQQLRSQDMRGNQHSCVLHLGMSVKRWIIPFPARWWKMRWDLTSMVSSSKSKLG